jgi:hypothetical protein
MERAVRALVVDGKARATAILRALVQTGLPGGAGRWLLVATTPMALETPVSSAFSPFPGHLRKAAQANAVSFRGTAGSRNRTYDKQVTDTAGRTAEVHEEVH